MMLTFPSSSAIVSPRFLLARRVFHPLAALPRAVRSLATREGTTRWLAMSRPDHRIGWRDRLRHGKSTRRSRVRHHPERLRLSRSDRSPIDGAAGFECACPIPRCRPAAPRANRRADRDYAARAWWAGHSGEQRCRSVFRRGRKFAPSTGTRRWRLICRRHFTPSVSRCPGMKAKGLGPDRQHGLNLRDVRDGQP